MLQNQRGLLIVFEGLDRCGKTTQCSRLLNHLDPNYTEGESEIVKLQRFPGNTLFSPFSYFPCVIERSIPSGQLIDDYLNKRAHFSPEEIHKLFAQNRKECK